jgi:hypothetical protein
MNRTLVSPIPCRTVRRHPVRAAIHPMLATRVSDVVPASTLRLFADEVAETIDAPQVLRYSNRQRLLRRARQLGVGRFDANLIIAAVQHRRGDERRSQAPEGVRLNPSKWLRFAALLIAVQLVLVAGGWWLLLGA